MKDMHYISVRVNNGDDFYLLLGDFLDEFYLADFSVQADMMNVSPVHMDKPEFIPFLAATAHKLALDYQIEPPEWIFEPRCYLPGHSPFFACKAKNKLRLLFMYKSPSEFKHRNLFVDENVLVRV